MSTFWEAVRDRLRKDERVGVVLVVNHSVHSPGTTGSRMAIFADGSTVGTIGGGVMELDIVRSAPEIFFAAEHAPTLRKLYHRKEGEGEKSGLICSGFQTNLYATMGRAEHADLLDALVKAGREDRSAVLEIRPTGIALLDLPAGGPRIQHDLVYSGYTWVYRESAMNLSRIAILGGGHCGLALSRLMHRLGYHVSIFDSRPRVPTMLENDFTDEKHIVDDLVDAASMIRLPEHTNLVVMTTELSSDVRALLGAAGRAFPFVGVMGSRAKIATMRKALLAEGVTAEWIDNLVAPVGLPIGSNTPDEIAVSVAGQLLQRRIEL